ncbi:MAG: YXWGXW repeat-containing protein [Dokdonella sp.]
MNVRTAVLLSVLALGGAMTLAPPAAQARVHVGINIAVPPPPLRVEVVPPPRAGYVWIPGYWGYGHRRHVWHRGIWHRDRPGYVYVAPRWDHRGDRYHFEGSRWDHDPNWRRDHGRHHGRRDH